MSRCPKCNEFLFGRGKDMHNCHPFTVVSEYGGTETYWASSAEDAAEKWAVDYNEGGDYALMNNALIIEVDGGEYRVAAEPEIHYSVTRVSRAATGEGEG